MGIINQYKEVSENIQSEPFEEDAEDYHERSSHHENISEHSIEQYSKEK